jgi:hypothetical protein
MPLPATVGALVRADIQAASDYLKRVDPIDSAAVDRLERLVNSSYELNRGCSVSGFRSHSHASPMGSVYDLSENFRLLLTSEFEKVVPEDASEELTRASKEIRAAVLALPVIAPTEPPPPPAP